MIIETSSNQVYAVQEAADAALAHCWIGVEVKHAKGGGWTPKAKARPVLVRKAGSRVIRH